MNARTPLFGLVAAAMMAIALNAQASVSPSLSTVGASAPSLAADGVTTSTITVTLNDTSGNPVSGKTVTLAKSGGSSTISAASGNSGANGAVTFTIADTVGETTTYTATDTTDSLVLSQTVSVTFTTVPWYNSGWRYRMTVQINHTNVSATLTNFPVLISVTNSALEQYAQTNGYDLLFTAGDGVTKLAHEIETYTSSNGLLVAWVNVPLVPATANTNLFLYYDNPTAANQQNATNVWDSGFKAVWHLEQTSGNFTDSTVYANTGTNSVSSTNKSGQIGKGQGFNGGGDEISVANASSLAITQQITLSAWVNYAVIPYNNTGDIVGKDYDGNLDAYFLRIESTTNSTNLSVGSYSNPTGTSYEATWPISGFNTNEWHLVTGLYDGANWTLYLDGAQKVTTPQTYGALSNAQPATIGAFDYNGTFSRFSKANIDEVRISSIARSSNWIAAEYANQKSPASFYTLSGAVVHPATSNYIHFNATALAGNTGPVNPTNGATSFSGSGLAIGDLVVFDGLVIDTSPGSNDAWGAVEFNQKSGGFYGVTLAQMGVLVRYTSVVTNYCQLWTNSVAASNFPTGSGVKTTNRLRIELTATGTGSTTNMSWAVFIDQGLTGSFTTTLSGANVTFTNNAIGLTFGSYVDPSLFSDYSNPLITAQPTNQTITAGGNATFTVTANGAGPLSYQWYFNGGAVSGATLSSYTLTNALAANAGNYTVVVTNYSGSVTSSAAVLTVNKASATVTLAGLSQTYSGSPESASASTTPGGLTVNFTYNGSSSPPTGAGSYAVVGTINDSNYQGSASGTLVISTAPVTVASGLTANNKSYDGTATATIASNNVVLSGVAAVDAANVRLSTNGYAAAFASVSVGNGIAVTISGLALAGGAATNYTLGQPSLTANITARTLTISATGTNKVYDGTSNTTVTLSDNRVAGDSLTTSYATAAFSDKNVGTNKTVYVSGIAVAGTNAANYTANTNTTTTASITAAPLTVTANNTNRVYGAPNPAFTAGYSGFVNGETTAVLSGAPALTTTASAGSSVAGSPYAITATNGTLGAANYSFNFINGQLTIKPAGTANAVSSSANPSPTGSNVTFTAALTAVSPGSGTPTGSVQFVADGVSLGSSVSLTNGIASLGASSLSHGTHAISAQYSGDGNFYGSTNSLSPSQTINSAPIAANINLQRDQTTGVKIQTAAILASDSDPDGDTVTLVSVSATSAAGGTEMVYSNWVIYEPPPGLTNGDSFSYVIADSYGLQSTGSVFIAVATNLAQSQNIVTVSSLGSNSTFIQFQGIVGRPYTIQYTTNLSAPNWQSLGSASADPTGSFAYTDNFTNNLAARFYRSTYP